MNGPDLQLLTRLMLAAEELNMPDVAILIADAIRLEAQQAVED